MHTDKAIERRRLVMIAQEMLDGKLSFLEWSAKILAIKSMLHNISDNDQDFVIFKIIQSETDHLPLEEQRSLWSPGAFAHLTPELERAEKWAKSFAPQACRNLIARFGCKRD